MTELNKEVRLDDLDPTRPPANGETFLYQSRTGHLVTHGPDGVLVEAADGFSLETSPDGMQETNLPAGCQLVIADTAVIVGREERRAGRITTRTLHFDGGGSLAVMTDDAMTMCEAQRSLLAQV